MVTTDSDDHEAHFHHGYSSLRSSSLRVPHPSPSLSATSSSAPTLSHGGDSSDDDFDTLPSIHSTPILPSMHNTEPRWSTLKEYLSHCIDEHDHNEANADVRSHDSVSDTNKDATQTSAVSESPRVDDSPAMVVEILDYDESIWSKLQTIYSDDDDDKDEGDEESEQEQPAVLKRGYARKGQEGQHLQAEKTSSAMGAQASHPSPADTSVEVLEYDESCWARLQLAYPTNNFDAGKGDEFEYTTTISRITIAHKIIKNDNNTSASLFVYAPTVARTAIAHRTIKNSSLSSRSKEATVILDYDESCWAKLQLKYREVEGSESDSEMDGDDEAGYEVSEEEDGEKMEGEEEEEGDSLLNVFGSLARTARSNTIILDYDESIWTDLQSRYPTIDEEEEAEGIEGAVEQLAVLKPGASLMSLRFVEEGGESNAVRGE